MRINLYVMLTFPVLAFKKSRSVDHIFHAMEFSRSDSIIT